MLGSWSGPPRPCHCCKRPIDHARIEPCKGCGLDYSGPDDKPEWSIYCASCPATCLDFIAIVFAPIKKRDPSFPDDLAGIKFQDLGECAPCHGCKRSLKGGSVLACSACGEYPVLFCPGCQVTFNRGSCSLQVTECHLDGPLVRAVSRIGTGFKRLARAIKWLAL